MAGRRALWWASAGAAVGALTLHDGTRDAVTGFGALAVRNSQTTVAAGRVAWLYKVHYPKGERRGRHALPAVRLGRAAGPCVRVTFFFESRVATWCDVRVWVGHD